MGSGHTGLSLRPGGSRTSENSYSRHFAESKWSKFIADSSVSAKRAWRRWWERTKKEVRSIRSNSERSQFLYRCRVVQSRGLIAKGGLD
jgi:hypothetical protein